MPGTDFPLPANLPVPIDDGAAAHLRGMTVPEISLRSTRGTMIELRQITTARAVLYCYPMTGVPEKPLPEGWDAIPGARGCTPQTCSFRDHYADFLSLATEVCGISTQSSEYQSEMAARLRLPFQILSDAEFKLTKALRLPTFEVGGRLLLKRLTMIVKEHRIENVFYPVFPPDQDANNVLNWLKSHPISRR